MTGKAFSRAAPEWTVEYSGDAFERFVRKLDDYQQAVLFAAIQTVLAVHGPDSCAGEWGKPLGGGLYEFRVRRSLNAIRGDATAGGKQAVLLRVFCAFYGKKVVLLHHGYDKQRDSSQRRQQREIATARALHAAWKRGH